MKKTHLPFLSMIIVLLHFIAFVNDAYAYPGGSPAGYTGSPADGQNCTACHGGSAATVSDWMTSNIPSSGYVAGTSYTITVTVTGSGRKGFEVSPQSTDGTLLGTLTPGTGNKLVGSGKYVTQSSGNNSNPAVWNFTWTAPSVGTGPVTFYGAFTVNEPTTKISTMVVSENAPFSVQATATPSSICEGQTSQLNAVATAGSGTYTYSWTSIPPGFSSTIQNPVVQPTQTTQYISSVNDGTLTALDTVEVTVTQPPMSFAGNDTTYCITITQIPLNGTASYYSAVQWTTSGDGTFSSPANLVSLYYPGPGDKASGFVNLYLTAAPVSPCAGPAASARHIVFDPCNSVDGLTGKPNGFSISPNPCNGNFTIVLHERLNDRKEIAITNIEGKTVYTGTSDSQGTVNIDLSGCSKGMYFVRIFTDSGSMLQKLVIQ